jgi:two-component system, cell cycle response regulator
LLDWVLPHVDGVELCRRLRNAGSQHFYTYTVLLTAKDSPADLLEGMRAGADDYLIKPFEPLELKARLLAGQRILDLQQNLIEARELLRVAATYDALTKLLNRAEILRLLEAELARCNREQKPVGVILADVDHFKNVNDSLGHSAGDAVLVEVAKRLKANHRIYDGVGRYGGEEFLLILPGCSLENTARRADATRHYVCQEAVTTPRGPVRVTVSFGDVALYRAKK